MRRARTITAVAIFAIASSPIACELLVDTSPLDPQNATGSDASNDTTSGGDGSQNGDSSSQGDSSLPADAACPGDAGPSMIRIGSFCIDSTEVTNVDYEAFLATSPTVSAYAPASCNFKNNFDHDGTWSPLGTGNFPASEVDWCDAYAYCKWAGKRLCGDPGGGEVPFASFADPAHDEWFSACSEAGVHTYAYGDTFDETKCNTLFADGGEPAGGYKIEPVANRATCQGSVSGLYDMTGNMAEWEDACDDSAGGDAAAEQCRIRGGSAHGDKDECKCAAGVVFATVPKRSDRDDDLGFRCCSP